MDKLVLGRRIADAREGSGLTQDALGKRVGLDRTAVSRLEKGERKVSVQELVEIAEVLGKPVSFFVAEPVEAVVSRRSQGRSTGGLDLELEGFAQDVATLLSSGQLVSIDPKPAGRVPATHEEAEILAADLRQHVGLGQGPIHDLGQVCEELGLVLYAVDLGAQGADGGCVEVRLDGAISAGVAVVNAAMPGGRRRMTAAHELAHWVCGDAYDLEAGPHRERMLNSVAIHFLAPRGGVIDEWNGRSELALRDRCLAIAAVFRLSWSAVLLHLRNLGLITGEQWRQLDPQTPSAGDYARLRLSWPEEFQDGYLSPAYVAAVLEGHAAGRLSEDRTLELLRGLFHDYDLPNRAWSRDDLRRSFEGHGG